VFPDDTFTDAAIGFVEGLTDIKLLKSHYQHCNVNAIGLKHKLTLITMIADRLDAHQGMLDPEQEIEVCDQVLNLLAEETPSFFM